MARIHLCSPAHTVLGTSGVKTPKEDFMRLIRLYCQPSKLNCETANAQYQYAAETRNLAPVQTRNSTRSRISKEGVCFLSSGHRRTEASGARARTQVDGT